MFSFLKKKTPTQPEMATIIQFWTWFRANAARVAHEGPTQERAFNELKAQLQRVHPGLTYELGVGNAAECEFVVSADGIDEVAPFVLALVRAAPPLPGWKVTAFRQPKDLEMKIRISALEMGVDSIEFVPVQEGEKVGVVLYVKGYTHDMQDQFKEACFLWLDNVLGEYTVMTRIGSVDVQPHPGYSPQGAWPLRDLRALVPPQSPQ